MSTRLTSPKRSTSDLVGRAGARVRGCWATDG
jgi:hypothetical protein